MTSDALRALRSEFPALDGGLCFLDWAATGLLPESTRRALVEFAEKFATCPTALSVWPWSEHGDMPGATRTEARALLASMLGSRPADVAFVPNTTTGLQIAAESIRTQEGDNVVLFDSDYLAVGLPWTMSARVRKLELRTASPRGGGASVEEIMAATDERTRAVVVSTTAWTTGALTDVEALGAECAARGVQLVLDAVQTFGVVPLDVRAVPAAFVACGGHKWLCSPLGAGFLYASPAAAARARPQRFGFLAGRPAAHKNWGEWFRAGEGGVLEEPIFEAKGSTFEDGGTPSWIGALGLHRMASLLSAAAPGEILAHVRGLGDRLIAGLDRLNLEVLTPRDPARRAGTLVFRAPHGREQELAWCDDLRRRRIAVSARFAKGKGGVRVSLHGMNLAAEVDRILEALADLVGA